jgi:hypothetical protein
MATWGGFNTMDGKEGRRFCIKCRKLIRPGELYEWKASPVPFKRRTKYSYWHYDKCPSEIKK